MYDVLGDAESYTSETVLERAYALGVASVCGNPDEETYARLKEKSPDAYDESIIELSYEEGRASALELEANGSGTEEVWQRLVEAEFDWVESESTSGSHSGAPEALRAPDIQPKEGLPDKFDLPSFLRKE